MRESRGSRRSLRGWRCGVTVALLAALAATAAPASADDIIGGPAPDPMTTNVPYVAWRGEQVKVVKCDEGLGGAVAAEPFVEEWSNSRDPRVEESTVRFFTSSTGRPCVAFDITSLEDGLARIKLVATNEAGDPVLKHQFLVIWLSLETPSIREVAATDQTGGPAGSAASVGDPLGDGKFTAGSRNGRVQVEVEGSFPHPFAPSGRFTLPDDWATLARALAADATNPNGNAAGRWDIHDDRGSATDRHVAGFCTPPSPSAVDDVDNCQGGGDAGPFSNRFGQGVSAFGPFDPARPATLLSNGALDAGDAPMPAARVDVSIQPNTGAAGDISGAGALAKVDKTVVYSRNGNGTSNPHNLYAPYYKQWLPATSSPLPEASGIDGPAQGNNFPGFLTGGGLYDNWDIAAELRTAPVVPTSCNRFVDFTGDDAPGGDVPRTQPYGAQSVAVYTDEHGEAQVAYRPYAGGFYFDSLPVLRNNNRGCDLQDVDTLGTADIRAIAQYPYQPVSDTPKTSGTLRKTVGNLFNKALSYWPKGPGAENANARIVVVHANDIDGTPFAGERVCFNVGEEADGARAFTGTVVNGNTRFTVGGGPAELVQGADICRTLDANGNAAIEVMNSDPQVINVIAEFIDEGLLRSIDVDFRTGGTTGGTPPPTPNAVGAPVSQGTVAPAAAAGTAAPTVVQITQTASPARASELRASAPTTAAAKKKVARRVSAARVVRLKGGTRVLMVRVASTRSTERIKIRMKGRRTLTKRVRTNRLVRVAGVKVPRGVKVKVTLVR